MYKRPVGEPLILQTPPRSLQSEMTPRRRSVICQAASPLLSPNFSPGHMHKPTVGCFLASTPIARSKQAVISPHPLHIPRVTPGGGTTMKMVPSGSSGAVPAKRKADLSVHHLQSPRPTSTNLQSPRSSCIHLQSPSPRAPPSNGMCNEAYQLMQFCNHCNGIGAMDVAKTPTQEPASPAVQCLHREKSLLDCSQDTHRVPSQESINKSVLDPKLAELLDENSHHHQQQIEDSQGASYYPFIAPPTGNRNVSLSQLNNRKNGCKLDPGPPKELNVTKCKPKIKGESTIEQRASFDSAVRPVVYDWNGWWEAEHVLCMMNEESYMNYIECQSEDNIKQVLEERKQAHTDKPATMTPDRWQRRSCSHFGFRRGSGQNWVRRLKIRKPISPMPLPEKSKSSKPKHVGRHCEEFPSWEVKDKNLKLIVSIPFRQLITDRQMKKYCVAGAKYRVPTEYME